MLNNFNRVATIIFALLILGGGVIILLVVFGAMLPDEVLPYGWFSGQLEGVASATGSDKVIAIGVSITLALGMLVALSLELMPHRRRFPLLIKSDESGILTLEQESARHLASKIGLTVQGVRDIDSQIGETSGGLAITCNASLALGANVPEIGAELQSRIKQDVEQLTGLPVAHIVIKSHYESVEARSLAVR
jgi:hypothetical protein